MEIIENKALKCGTKISDIMGFGATHQDTVNYRLERLYTFGSVELEMTMRYYISHGK